MTCTRPMKAWKYPDGSIHFKGGVGEPFGLPCGGCLECRLDYGRQYAVRCMHEMHMRQLEHKPSSFITLTYEDEKLPEDGGLQVRDWQLFAKRLRKKIGPFRFFAGGEYTDEGRPHFHACIFGTDFMEDRSFWTTHNGNKLYVSKLLAATWTKGFCSIGDLTYNSAAYVARYMVKKRKGPGSEEAYIKHHPVSGEMFQVAPEFSLMSRGTHEGGGARGGLLSEVQERNLPG